LSVQGFTLGLGCGVVLHKFKWPACFLQTLGHVVWLSLAHRMIPGAERTQCPRLEHRDDLAECAVEVVLAR